MEFYFQNSLAPSTQHTHASAKNHYSQFCSQYDFPVLPVSEHQLCQYVSFLAEAGVSHVSIKCYLSAIRHLQIAHSLPDPHISFGFVHSGEITVPLESAYDPAAHLTYSDISINDPGHPTLMKLRLKASKTDSFRKGVDIVMGRTYNELCPIEAMLSHKREQAGLSLHIC